MNQYVEFFAPAGGWGAWGALIVIAVVCLGLSAFVSGSEIAYFGLTPQEIGELKESAENDSSAKKAFRMISHSEQLLATILICNNLVNITMVVLLTFAINRVVQFHSDVVSFLVQSVFLTFLLLLFGEILPKLIARGRTMAWVTKASPLLSFFYAITSPISKLMVRSTSILNKVVTKKQETISTEELERALEISDVEEGQDKEMLEGILTFGEKQAGEIMIARVDVTDIEFHSKWSEVVKVITESGYSRIPVYDTSQDTISGILYSKDLLPYIGTQDDSFRWQKLIRQAYFVPETRRIDDLLEDFRRRKMHIAIVIDEYGGTCGIVTLEDIIEEIVGEIDDEYDDETSLYKQLTPDTYIFDAKVPITDFCHIVGIESEALGDIGEAETLAGLLLEVKGDFPENKESLTAGCCRFLVLEMERHRITSVRVNIDRRCANQIEEK